MFKTVKFKIAALCVLSLLMGMLGACSGPQSAESDTSGMSTTTTSAADSSNESDSGLSSDELSDGTTTGSSGSGTNVSADGTTKTGGSKKTTTVKTTAATKVEDKKLSGKFELQIFTGGYGSEFWEYIIAGFEKEFPELKVVAHLDSNINKQMLTRWIKGNPPDFVFLEGSNMPSSTWIAEGKLADLTSFYNSATVYGTTEKLSDKLNKSLIPKHNGKIYEMPIIMSTYGIWYDQKLIGELGVSVPKNIDELMKVGAAAKSKGKATLCYPGVNSGYLVQGMILPAVAAYGQEYFDSVDNATSPEVFTDARFKSVLTRLNNFARKGYVLTGTVALNHIQSQIQWLNRNALFIPNGLWLENEMKDDTPADFKMRYAPSCLNLASQKQVILSTGICVGVAEKAKNKDAALEFIRYIYRDDNLVKMTEEAGVPVAASVDTSASTKMSDSAKYVQQVFNSGQADFVSKTGDWGTVDTTINDVVNKIVLGEITVDEACNMLAEATRAKNAQK